MAKPKQPERWKSAILAAAMALSGTLFMFGKLGSLAHSGMLSWQATAHASPLPVVLLGVGLLLVGQEEGQS
ncbi:MAG: hypothetical protein ACRD3L_08735 [Terriglobales bacterium]